MDCFLKPFLLIFMVFVLNCPGKTEQVPEVRQQADAYTQKVTLKFAQPLVSRTVVENGQQVRSGEEEEEEVEEEAAEEKEEFSPADLGLDIFTISGDAQYQPVACWTDQDRLEISFVQGTSCRTEYKFQLKPGTKYLGGELAPTLPQVFRCPPGYLEGSVFMDARGVGVMVCARNQTTRESRQLSAQTAPRFVFREAHRKFFSGDIYYTTTVEADAEPAFLKQGIGQDSLKVLQERGAEVWQKLREDTPLPGHVVLRPKQPLDPEKEWHLLLAPSENPVFCDDDAVCTSAAPMVEMGTGVEWNADAEKGYRLQVRFSHPMSLADMPALFDRMQLEVGGAVAVKSGAGRKKVTFNNRVVEFRYAGVLEPETVDMSSDWRDSDEDVILTYTPQGQARGFIIEVSATAPELLDVVIPAGTASYLGFRTQGEHRHRIALNPGWPELAPGLQVVLPLKGERTLRVPCANVASMKVSAWRLAHEMTATAYDNSLSNAMGVAAAKLRYDLLRSRELRGMYVMEHELSSAENVLESARKKERRNAARSRKVLEGATPLPGCVVNAGSDAMLSSGEAVLKLDAATGGPAVPGMYLLRLQQVANAPVRAALRRLGRAEESLDASQDVLVQVTDLNVTMGEDAVLVNRYSDGRPVERGTVSYLDAEKKVHHLSIENGIAWLPENLEGSPKAWVRSGDDVVMVELPYRSSYRSMLNPREPKASTLLVLDRPLYRPGDTVYVRGVLRRVLADGSCALPAEKTAKLAFCRPDGSEWDTREVSLGEFGAFETSYTLPEGEEDVTGNYRLLVEAGDFRESVGVNCQVFRRDSFKVSLEIDVDPVLPEEFTVRVSAVDYSGTPVANAACELLINGLNERLTLDAAGKAEITRKVWKQQREHGFIAVGGSVSNDREEYVRIETHSKDIHKGDFYIRVRNGRVVLYDARTDKVLGRDQTLDLRLVDVVKKPVLCPNGLGLKEEKKVELWSGTLHIPANAELGVPLPDAESWRDQAEYWEMSGKDSAGREVCYTEYVSYYRKDDSSAEMSAHLQGRVVELRAELPYDGTAHLFVGQRQKLRHLTLPVQAGKHAYPVELQPGEEGTLSFSLVLPGRQPGETAVHTSCRKFVPISRYKLELDLEVPEEACRPAQTITISGAVRAAGKPADAEVTLYAVDDGMLSVGDYTTPEPEEFFYAGTARSFSPISPGIGKKEGLTLSRVMLPAFWRGDLMGPGYSLTPYPTWYSYKGGRRSFFGGGLLLRMGRSVVHAVDGLLSMGTQYQYVEECAPAPMPVVTPGVYHRKSKKLTAGLRSGSGYFMEADSMYSDEGEDEEGEELSLGVGLDASLGECGPYLRTDFTPVAVWRGALRTDAAGRFSVEVQLPDTLTSYTVVAMAVDRSGTRFGSALSSITVNQPVMLTPGTPLFMSLGDTLRLPLSIVNNTDEPGTWRVTLEGAAAPQEITLAARQSGTLYFDFTATTEGEQKLRWMAQGKPGSDAVQGEFSVRFPAPVLKEVHRLTLSAGDAPVHLASLLGSDVATAARGEMELVASANPLLHLAGAADYLLEYPYGCTEQRASALIPWLLYEHLAPFCPKMAQTRPEEVEKVVKKVIEELLPRQCEDGGLSFWGGWNKSCLWATAHAGYVLKLAQEQGFEVPQEAMDKLYRYLWWASTSEEDYRTRFAIARTRGKTGQMKDILRETLEKNEEEKLFLYRETKASMQFMLSMLENPDGADAAFRTWLRSTGRDYRHGTTQGNAWNLFALVEYLKLKKGQGDEATLALQDGSAIKLGKGAATVPLSWQPGQEMKTLPTTLAAKQGTVYAAWRVRALPPTTDYPGVTEHGLQVTRLYETKGADGVWRPATSFKVGDVVRVTLTCAKVAEELKYLVLEDYMPACMEAINPNVPGQAAGLESLEWSYWFDHREYLADRVRGFCTRWEGRDLLNMRYYARVKRAGTSTAPPAQAQLMYEPQVYGLSPNAQVVSEP
ncbi:MAG: hypothetical protein IKW48_05675 [Akkermansia sp.]|nr:hypothetical protein [Akkermansia sp.]